MKVRKANKKDFNIIANIFKDEFNKKPYLEGWSDKTALAKINEYNKKKFSIIVIEENKEIIGFAIFSKFMWSDGFRGKINELVITSKFQGKGIGKILLKYIENYFIKKNINKLLLVSHKLSNAFQIWNNFGFKEDNLISLSKNIK